MKNDSQLKDCEICYVAGPYTGLLWVISFSVVGPRGRTKVIVLDFDDVAVQRLVSAKKVDSHELYFVCQCTTVI